MKKFPDVFGVGLVLGLLGPILGALLFYKMQYPQYTLEEFFTLVYMGKDVSRLISIGAIFNIAIFYPFVHFHKLKVGKGVITSTFLWVTFSIMYIYL